ncbi:MAG: hypothetical protein ATN32_07690 [Candidatus Epulonipiscium fishelsonii]|nr:MAG: hypothetical protein ATN32_07690 [Epulopiscium sp. AS2M-Bin002]
MKKALITGITGQDGSYLTEFLLDKGYEVHGIIRRHSKFSTDRIDYLFEDKSIGNEKLFLHYGDLTDSSNLNRLIEKIEPTEIYNLAAQSHVAVSFEVPEYTAETTGIGTKLKGSFLIFKYVSSFKSKERLRLKVRNTENLFFLHEIPLLCTGG